MFLEQAQPVVKALEEGDMSPGIKWCIANRPRLKKIKSTLEFQLRLQAFVGLSPTNVGLFCLYIRSLLTLVHTTELVRKDALDEAILYARKHVGPAVGGDCHEHKLSALKRHMGLLAFGKAQIQMQIQLQLQLQILKSTRYSGFNLQHTNYVTDFFLFSFSAFKATQVHPYKFFLQVQRRSDLAERLKAEMWQVWMVGPQV